MENKVLVLKFGGAAVREPENFSQVADIIAQKREVYQNIAIVVSAMGNTTDELLKLATRVNPDPPRRELDMLITVGERVSIALLAMALARKGLNAKSFTGSQSGIITNSLHTDAKIIDVRPNRLQKAFEEGYIVIVAGFQGVSVQGEITSLGRGGSDTSAVALAAGLKSQSVEFYKNVSGVFDVDPHKNCNAKQYSIMSYDEAYELSRAGAKILHPRCILLAKQNGICLHVRSFLNPKNDGTFIGHMSEKALIPSFECVNG
jgi:aspartate kinase